MRVEPASVQSRLAREDMVRISGGQGWSDERITEAFNAGVATVERLRRRFVEDRQRSATIFKHPALRPTADQLTCVSVD